MGGFLETLLSNNTVLIAIVTFAATVLCKTAIKIFRLGVTFKTELATKEDQRIFEESIRKDLRAYKEEIQKTVLTICMDHINKHLNDIKEYKTEMEHIKELSTRIDMKSEEMNEKYSDVKSVIDTVRILNNKVTRLEYGNNTKIERRSEDK